MVWGPPDDEEPGDRAPGGRWGSADDEEPGDQVPGGGWVPPEARNWRHPSEVAAAQALVTFDQRDHRWRRKAAVVGVTALSAVLIGALLLAHAGSSTSTSGGRAMPVVTADVAGCCNLSSANTAGLEQAIVSVESAHGAHQVLGCAVVVDDGLVATTSAALRGDRKVRVVAVTGRVLRAVVVASDATSGIVLLRVSGDLPAARLVTASGLRTGETALAMSITVRRRTGPLPQLASGRVVAVGAAAPGDGHPAMAAITVRGRDVPAMPGEALVDRQGRVAGILEAAKGARRDFVPMSLVIGVSDDLETIGHVRHGWLGLEDVTAPGRPGVKVVWVDPHGAAAHSLRAGDVIVRINGRPVATSAALRSLLYVLSPGTKVSVEAVRGAHDVRTDVRLAPAP